VAKLAERAGPHWKRDEVLELDPSVMDKVKAIDKAQNSGKI
jgi:hypothetical protein